MSRSKVAPLHIVRTMLRAPGTLLLGIITQSLRQPGTYPVCSPPPLETQVTLHIEKDAIKVPADGGAHLQARFTYRYSSATVDLSLYADTENSVYRIQVGVTAQAITKEEYEALRSELLKRLKTQQVAEMRQINNPASRTTINP